MCPPRRQPRPETPVALFAAAIIVLAMTSTTDLIYAACSTNGAAEGLVAFRVDRATGAMAALSGVRQGLTCPLYVTAHPSRKAVFVADFIKECDGVPGGAIVAFNIETTGGAATPINRKPAHGTVPCYITLTADGRFALVANYGDGSVSVLPVGPDGALGDAVAHVQHEPTSVGETGKCGRNAHSIILSPDERFAFAADLGIDAIFIYRFDRATGQLTPHAPACLRTAKKAGPRHLAFAPGGRFLYAVTEYDNTLIAMSYDDQRGALEILQTQPTLPAGAVDKSYGADVVIHPSGRTLYATNRGHDSIVQYHIDPNTGLLTLADSVPSGGSFPRSIVLASSARVLVCANEKADAVQTFAVHERTGALTATGHQLAMAKPASLWRVG